MPCFSHVPSVLDGIVIAVLTEFSVMWHMYVGSGLEVTTWCGNLCCAWEWVMHSIYDDDLCYV